MAIGQPTGIDLCYGTTDGNTLPQFNDGELRTIIFNTSVNVVEGQRYTIIARCTGEGLSNSAACFSYGISDPPAYCSSSDAGVSWVGPFNQNCYFDVGTDSHTPSQQLQAQGFHGDNWMACIFTASASYSISQVILNLCRGPVGDPEPGVITVSIREVEGNLPRAPTDPTPAHEATEITLDDTLLTWKDGGGAETYDVYFRPYGEFFHKIASDIEDTYFDVLDDTSGLLMAVTYNGHYSYGQLYLWCVIAKNEYGSNYDPPTDFGIGYGGTIWEFNAMVFDPPLPSGVTLDADGNPTGTPTGGNNMIVTRRLVAAAENRLWYEDI